jgi:hypothetical protein
MKGLMKKFFGDENDPEKRVKSFDEETADMPEKEIQKRGMASIAVSKIVGSVGRAHELDGRFRYRRRAVTQRYKAIELMVQEGRPMEPIKVLKVKRKRRDTEYYVVDGHHRVAHAKLHGYQDINADVSEVMDTDEDTTPDDAEN